MEFQSAGRLDGIVTFMNLLLCMVIFLITAARVQGDSCPTSLPRMAGKLTSYGSFMPASNTPTCDFKILMTLRMCCTPSDLGYCVSVVLFCVILLTLIEYPGSDTVCLLSQFNYEEVTLTLIMLDDDQKPRNDTSFDVDQRSLQTRSASDDKDKLPNVEQIGKFNFCDLCQHPHSP